MYRLDRTHAHEVVDGAIEPRGHRVAPDTGAWKRRAFGAAYTPGSGLVTAVRRDGPGGPAPGKPG